MGYELTSGQCCKRRAVLRGPVRNDCRVLLNFGHEENRSITVRSSGLNLLQFLRLGLSDRLEAFDIDDATAKRER